MNKVYKAAAIFAVTAFIAATPVFAQQEPSELASNTLKATAGVFGSEVDDSLSVHDFAGMEINKWFGFVGYGGDTTYFPVSLGFAKKLGGGEEGGGLHLGTWYTGNVVRVREYWSDSVVTNYDLLSQRQTSQATTTTYVRNNNVVSSNNQIEALIGVGSMGFKVGFFESVEKIKKPYGGYDTSYENDQYYYGDKMVVETKYPDGTVEHTTGDIVEYSRVSGIIIPSLTWGMSLGEEGKIRPLVKAGLGIALENAVNDYRLDSTYRAGSNPPGTLDGSAYTTIKDKVIGPDNIIRSGSEYGLVYPDIYVGAGIDFAKFTLDLGYGINFAIANNSYDVAGFKGDVKGTVWWWGYENKEKNIAGVETDNLLMLGISEVSAVGHSINLGISTDKEFDGGLKLGLAAGLDVGIDKLTIDSYTTTLTKNEIKYSNAAGSAYNEKTTSETREFTANETINFLEVNPYINLGAQYTLVPGRLAINAGIGLKPLAYKSETTRKAEKPDSNNNNDPSSTTKTKTYNGKGDLIEETVTVNGGDKTVDSVEVNSTWSYLSAGLFGGFVFSFSESLALDTSFGWYAPESAGNTSFNANIGFLNVLLSFKF